MKNSVLVQFIESLPRRGLSTRSSISMLQLRSTPGSGVRQSHSSEPNGHKRRPITCISDTLLALAGSVLCAAGKFDWDTPLVDYVKEASILKGPSRDLAARHLLAQSSGLDFQPQLLNNGGENNLTAYFVGQPLFEPNQLLNRSFYNSLLLHRILNRVRPRCVDDLLMDQNLLNNSSLDDNSIEATTHDYWYTMSAAPDWHRQKWIGWHSMSTLELARLGYLFVDAVQESKNAVVPRSNLNQILGPHKYLIDDIEFLHSPHPPWYGLEDGSLYCYGHCQNHRTLLLVSPVQNLSIAVNMADADNRVWGTVFHRICKDYLPNTLLEFPKRSKNAAEMLAHFKPNLYLAAKPDQVTGKYVSRGEVVTIASNDSRNLVMQIEGQGKKSLDLKRQSDNSFLQACAEDQNTEKVRTKFILRHATGKRARWMRFNQRVFRRVVE